MLPYPFNRFFSTYRILKFFIFAGGLMLSMGLPSWAQRQMPWRTQAPQSVTQSLPQAAPQTVQEQPRVIDERETPSTETAPSADNQSSLGRQLQQLNMSPEEFDWRVDWWKYLLIAVVFIVVLLVLLRIGKALLRLLAFAACVAFSSFFAYYLGPLFAPWLVEKVPQLDMPQIPILYWSYGLVFLCAYIIAIIILRLIKRPFDITAPKKNKGN